MSNQKHKYSKKVKNVKPLNTIMAGLYNKRCDREVCIKEDLDITNLLQYIDNKNKRDVDYTLKLFHCFVAMSARLLYERPLLNRYVQNLSYYERNDKIISFVAKKRFTDHDEEAVVSYYAKDEDTIDLIAGDLLKKIGDVRKPLEKQDKNADKANANVNFFGKLPKPILKVLFILVRFLDKYGWVPASLRSGDTAYSSVLLSNLGSIKCNSVYHHLNNYGTNSAVITIGTIKKTKEKNSDGIITDKATVDISVTLDEIIADGFYFAKSLKILNFMCACPETLDIPFNQPLDMPDE